MPIDAAEAAIAGGPAAENQRSTNIEGGKETGGRSIPMAASTRFRRILALASVSGALFFAPAARADALKPTAYQSASGHCELFVEPSSPTGEDWGRYRFTRDGAEIWAGDRPFTLQSATVTDDGVVAGYAYEGGVRYGHHVRRMGLSVIIIGPDGTLRQRDEGRSHPAGRLDRDPSGFFSPAVLTLIADTANDRLIVVIPIRTSRVYRGPAWWTYRLSDGTKTGDVTPERPVPDGKFASLVTIQLVPDTELLLAHWFTEGARGTRDAALSLLRPDGKAVWTQRFPEEYDGLGDRSDDWDVRKAQVEIGERRFSFRSYKSAERILYVIRSDDGETNSWRVDESRRVPTQDPPPC